MCLPEQKAREQGCSASIDEVSAERLDVLVGGHLLWVGRYVDCAQPDLVQEEPYKRTVDQAAEQAKPRDTRGRQTEEAPESQTCNVVHDYAAGRFLVFGQFLASNRFGHFISYDLGRRFVFLLVVALTGLLL